ncbi:MAG: hypothetical protein IPM59_13930 [Chloracidobacterium sp.]|nr:hypothetical protein [Chloracidobacterium sp.]
MNPIEAFSGSDYYSRFLDSFSAPGKIEYDRSGDQVSKALYLHICKMKFAAWRHRVQFKRNRKSAFADIFQDLIAFYLMKCLPEGFEVQLEPRRDGMQPDIAIYKNDVPVFLVEIKTNIGWNRPDFRSEDPFSAFSQRVEALAATFEVPRENIIYVFEDAGNLTGEFRNRCSERPRSTEFPYSIIFALFEYSDPYYWKGFVTNRSEEPPQITDQEILDRAEREKYIITRFEEVLYRIEQSCA